MFSYEIFSLFQMSRKEFSLHPLQEAAGEKGGLVGPGRMYSSVDRENLKGSLR